LSWENLYEKTAEELRLFFNALSETQIDELNLCGSSLPINDLNKLQALEGALPNIKTIHLDYSEVSTLSDEYKLAIREIFPNLEKTIFLDAGAPEEPTPTKTYNNAIRLGFPHPFPTLFSLAEHTTAQTRLPGVKYLGRGHELISNLEKALDNELKERQEESKRVKAEEERQEESKRVKAEEERQKKTNHFKDNITQHVSDYIKKRPKGFYYYFSKIFSFLSNRAKRINLAEKLLEDIDTTSKSDALPEIQLITALESYQTSIVSSRHWWERKSHKGLSEVMIEELSSGLVEAKENQNRMNP
jgi:hypothetical protein